MASAEGAGGGLLTGAIFFFIKPLYFLSPSRSIKMQYLDGIKLSHHIKELMKGEVKSFIKEKGVTPHLVVLQVGENPASQLYVQKKTQAAARVGITSQVQKFSSSVGAEELKACIHTLNRDHKVHALLVQLPLPGGLAWQSVINEIDPQKDVDGLTAENQGLAWSLKPRVVACTPAGIMALLKHHRIPLKGRRAVVVGRSSIVGQPVACQLLKADATVTICHSHTQNLSQITRQGDVVVVCAGSAWLLGKSDFKPGACVVDVGIHREEGRQTAHQAKKKHQYPVDRDLHREEGPASLKGKVRLKGDICPEGLEDHLSFFTPVPGGVGPMTVAMLLKNTLKLARLSFREKKKGL